jgi:Uma2 family endonuclease
VKLPRYAAAAIREVWIVDLAAGVVDVHRDPGPDAYRTSRRLVRGDDVSPEAFPDVVLPVDDILG